MKKLCYEFGGLIFGEAYTWGGGLIFEISFTVIQNGRVVTKAEQDSTTGKY